MPNIAKGGWEILFWYMESHDTAEERKLQLQKGFAAEGEEQNRNTLKKF